MPRGGLPAVPGRGRRSSRRGDRWPRPPRSSRRGCRASPRTRPSSWWPGRRAARSRWRPRTFSDDTSYLSRVSSGSSSMRCIITGTTASDVRARARHLGQRRTPGRTSAAARTWCRGSRPSVKCAKPHEWNSGAAIVAGLRGSSAGSCESSDTAGSSDCGLRARGALRRAGGAGGEDDRAALASRAAPASTGPRRRSARRASGRRACLRRRARPRSACAAGRPPRAARRTPRRRSSATGFSRFTTSASCGPAKAVLR